MKTTTTTTTTTATSPGQIFDHIIIIMLENQYLGDVLNNEIMQGFAKKGILLNNSYGVMHPSQTNYIASIAGNLCGVTDDVIPNSKLTQKTIVDLIENATSQLTWKAYMEGYSAHQKKVAEESSGYMTHHNPFHSFKNSTNSENVVDLAQLNDDLTNKTLPNYAWISPNMWNDGHFPMCQTSPTDNTPQPPYNANHLITQSASFLTSLFTQWNLFGDYPDTNTPLPANTLVVVTYDEAMYDNSYLDNVAGGVLGDSPNQIFTLLLGNVIQPLMTSSSDYNYVDEAFNHYSLLKTVETNFGLNDLQANDTDANEFQFLWNKEFQWQAVNADSGLEQLNNTTAMAATNSSFPGLDKPQDINKGFRLLTNIVYLDADNKLQHVWLTEDSGRYQIQPMYTVVSVTTATSLSLVNINGPVSASVGGIVTDDLLLAYIDSSIMELQYCNQSGEGDFTDGHWQPLTAAPANINGPVTALSLLPLPDKSGILLAFADSDGIKSAVYDSNEQQWRVTQLVNQINGVTQITLSALGANVLLVYTDPTDNNLQAMSYNCADYNAISDVNGLGYNYTQSAWSLDAFDIQHFPLPNQNGSSASFTAYAPDPQIFKAQGVLASATLAGKVWLLNNNTDGDFVGQNFSLNGILTSSEKLLPVPSHGYKQGCGYGTMLEASWNSAAMPQGVTRNADDVMSICTLDDSLILIYKDQSGNMQCYRGQYVQGNSVQHIDTTAQTSNTEWQNSIAAQTGNAVRQKPEKALLD